MVNGRYEQGRILPAGNPAPSGWPDLSCDALLASAGPQRWTGRPFGRIIGAPLWTLMVASEALDLLCFGFMAAGIERAGVDPSFPWSHGLFASAVWSGMAGVIALLMYRDRQTAGVIGLLVFSHWVLDFVSHSADLPLLFDGSPLVGLGLESSLAVGLIMELSLLAVGIAIYLVTRRKACLRRAAVGMVPPGGPQAPAISAADRSRR